MNKRCPESVPNIPALIALGHPASGDIVEVEAEHKAFIFEFGGVPRTTGRGGIADITRTGLWRLFVAWDENSAADAGKLLAIWRKPLSDP
jgi:hypothetical protein